MLGSAKTNWPLLTLTSWVKGTSSFQGQNSPRFFNADLGGHYGLTGCPIKTQKCLKKCGMVPKSAEWWQGIWNINFFCHSLKITSDILRYIRYSALQCHLAAAFCFIINVAWFIFSDLSSDAWAFSCVYTKRYIIYGQNSQSQEFQQNNLLKSCIGSLVKPE